MIPGSGLDYPGAAAAAIQSRSSLRQAYSAAQNPEAGELRAFFVHDAYGVPGQTWDQTIKQLADSGFNAVAVNLVHGGGAFYATTVPEWTRSCSPPVRRSPAERAPPKANGTWAVASTPAGPVQDWLTSRQILAIADEAKARWHEAGADLNAFSNVRFVVADLPGDQLGLAEWETITLNVNSAGRGWFIDPTPADDTEFTSLGDQGEQGRFDLLTVIAHELGHLLGLADVHTPGNTSIMTGTLGMATRRSPASADVGQESLAVDRVFGEATFDEQTTSLSVRNRPPVVLAQHAAWGKAVPSEDAFFEAYQPFQPGWDFLFNRLTPMKRRGGCGASGVTGGGMGWGFSQRDAPAS